MDYYTILGKLNKKHDECFEEYQKTNSAYAAGKMEGISEALSLIKLLTE